MNQKIYGTQGGGLWNPDSRYEQPGLVVGILSWGGVCGNLIYGQGSELQEAAWAYDWSQVCGGSITHLLGVDFILRGSCPSQSRELKGRDTSGKAE